MSLDLTLKDALSGLQASQAALQTISNNIANANTEGYSRKRADPKSLVIGGKGFGVEIGEVKRSVDEGILALLRDETGKAKQLAKLDNSLSQINQFFGRPEDNSSITHELADLASQFDALAVSPEVEAAQFLAVSSGADVLRELDSLSEEVQRLRGRANNDIDTTVTELNTLVATVANINGQIVQFTNSKLDASELKDQRDRALNSIAEIVDIEYFDTGTGAINVFAGSGQTIVNGGLAQTISYGAPSVIDARSQYTPNTASNYIGPGNTGHPVGGIPGIFVGEVLSISDITRGISAGTLKGLTDVRDFELPMLQAQLDELAEKLKVEINAVHNKGVGAPAVFGFTGDRFVATDTRFEAAGHLRIGIIDDTGVLRENKIEDLSLPEGFATYESKIFSDADAASTTTTAGQLTFTNDAASFAITVNYGAGASLAALAGAINGATGAQNIAASVVTTDGTDFNRLKITDTDGDTFNIIETGAGSFITDLKPRVRTVGDLATGLSTMTNLTASINTKGRFTLNTSNNLRLAINELTSSVSGAGDLNKGFSDFFGLNRFIDSVENFSRYRSDVFASSTTDAITTAGSLHFTGNDGTAWSTTVAYTAADTLTTLAANINTNTDLIAENVSAKIVADGATFRLELSDAEGHEFAIVETGDGSFLADSNVRTDTRGLSNRMSIREDIEQNNNFISRGTLQSNTFQSQAFDSKTTAFNATTPPITANGSLTFTINDSTTAIIDYPTTASLETVVSAINANVTLIGANITAEAIIDEADPTKFKLKINDANGDDFMIADSGGLNVDVSQGVAIGDGSIAEKLAEVFNNTINFSEIPGQGSIAGLAETNTTFTDYSAKILSVTSVRSQTINRELNLQENLQQELATKNASISGVNIDEELANLIIFEQAFLAAARIITTTQELFKELNDLL